MKKETSKKRSLFGDKGGALLSKLDATFACDSCPFRSTVLTPMYLRQPVSSAPVDVVFVVDAPTSLQFQSGNFSVETPYAISAIAGVPYIENGEIKYKVLPTIEPRLSFEQFRIIPYRQCADTPFKSTKSSVKLRDVCTAIFEKEISKYKPKVIIPIGISAATRVLRAAFPHVFEESDSCGLYMGYQIPSGKFNAYICPVYSETDFGNNYSYYNPSEGIVHKYVANSLKEALLRIKQHPFPCVNYDPTPSESVITYLYGAEQVASYFHKYLNNPSIVHASFDYETTTLHPEYKGAKPLCAAVTFAGKDMKAVSTGVFSFNEKAVEMTWKDFLQHPILKSGANIQFEERWSIRYFGTPVNNWFWDTNTTGHIQDAQPGTAGLKFMSLVYFGIGGYDNVVADYIESDETGLNRLDKLPPKTLHTYNAIDTILTMQIMREQIRELEVPLPESYTEYSPLLYQLAE